jgi:hypothetical protein
VKPWPPFFYELEREAIEHIDVLDAFIAQDRRRRDYDPLDVAQRRRIAFDVIELYLRLRHKLAFELGYPPSRNFRLQWWQKHWSLHDPYPEIWRAYRYEKKRRADPRAAWR